MPTVTWKNIEYRVETVPNWVSRDELPHVSFHTGITDANGKRTYTRVYPAFRLTSPRGSRYYLIQGNRSNPDKYYVASAAAKTTPFTNHGLRLVNGERRLSEPAGTALVTKTMEEYRPLLKNPLTAKDLQGPIPVLDVNRSVGI